MSIYATLAEFKQMSNKQTSGQDSAIQLCLDAAEAAIDAHCNRGVGGFLTAASATARTFPSYGGAVLRLPDCTTVTTVQTRTSTSWETLSSGDWVAFDGDADFPDFNRTPYAALMLTGTGRTEWPTSKLPLVNVTARWGYANSVPPTVKSAALAQATRWFKRFEGSFADATASGDMGSLQYRSALDPDVKMMLVNARLVKPTT